MGDFYKYYSIRIALWLADLDFVFIKWMNVNVLTKETGGEKYKNVRVNIAIS